MEPNNLTCVLEGANQDTPSRIEYCGLDIEIPKNALVLGIDSARLLLYGRAENLQPGKLIKLQKPQNSIKGWHLDDNLIWDFSMPRSITTRDGRFYLLDTFYEKNWEYYFPIIPQVLKDSKDILEGIKTEQELNNLCRRAF